MSYDHLVAGKKSFSELHAEICRLTPDTPWHRRYSEGYGKYPLIRQLKVLDPQHPWLKVPLKSCKGFSLSIDELKEIALLHKVDLGKKALSTLSILKRIQAIEPNLSIFDGEPLQQNPEQVEAEIVKILGNPTRHKTLTDKQTFYLKANWLVPFPFSLIWPTLQEKVCWYDRSLMSCLLQVMRSEREFYGDVAQKKHLEAELLLAQKDWDQMCAEGIVKDF